MGSGTGKVAGMSITKCPHYTHFPDAIGDKPDAIGKTHEKGAIFRHFSIKLTVLVMIGCRVFTCSISTPSPLKTTSKLAQIPKNEILTKMGVKDEVSRTG